MANIQTMKSIKEIQVALEARKGELRSIAASCCMSYHSLLRIKAGEGDPGHSKIVRLSEYLFPSRKRNVK